MSTIECSKTESEETREIIMARVQKAISDAKSRIKMSKIVASQNEHDQQLFSDIDKIVDALEMCERWCEK